MYPGLALNRFLREVEDIIQKRKNENISIDKLGEEFLKGIPFQYLLEESEFFGHKFYVNSNVLIPRPETEFLVDMVARDFKGKASRVLDVGTGSGVILLSLLAANVGKTGVGVDISPEALEVAKINSKRLNLENKASLLLSDRLDKVEGVFDLIVSNPPYIKASSHRELVHDSVDKYEPHQALYLPDDFYFMWFEDFFASIREHLKGTFFMEGHELELDDQAKLLSRLGFQKIEVLSDMAGTKRFLRAVF